MHGCHGRSSRLDVGAGSGERIDIRLSELLLGYNQAPRRPADGYPLALASKELPLDV